jgi:osmotically inducible lipoprotein OsmB
VPIAGGTDGYVGNRTRGLRVFPYWRFFHGGFAMRRMLKTGLCAAVLLAAPFAAQAGTLEGVGIGAGVGAAVAGPPGAIVGGVVGATVGGPNIVTRDRVYYTRAQARKVCWRDDLGRRHCRWR